MSKKKHHHEEHEEHVNHEAWVIPYADMLTLLMALFLVMWASSQQDVDKAKAISSGFADSLGIQGDGQGVGGDGVLQGATAPKVSPDKPEIMPKKQAEAFEALEADQFAAEEARKAKEALKQLQESIEANESSSGVPNELAFKLEARGLVVSIVSEGVLFDAGSADLRPEGRAVLDGLVGPLKGGDNTISIEGHTDDRPISNGRFPSNWELSTARASSVLRYLVDVHGFAASRLSASGYADQRPVGDNADEAGRAKNRRVDLALASAAPALPDSTTTDSTASDNTATDSTAPTEGE